MAPDRQDIAPAIALLSASDLGANQSILELQIEQLKRSGIRRFLVEVDNVSGGLLALADKSRTQGLSFEFVRSAGDARTNMQSEEMLVVLAEALFVAPDLLDQILRHSGSFVATVDGRDDNSMFERIDLNTRWAGIARVDANTVGAIADLPDGWSVASSLLRQALQHDVAFNPLPQQALQDGKLRIVRSVAEMRDLDRQILQDRASHVDGLIEGKLLGPLSVRIAQVFKVTSSAARFVNIATLLLSALAVILGANGWIITAIIAGSVTIGLSVYGEVVAGQSESGSLPKLTKWGASTLLIVAALLTTRADTSYSGDGMFAAATVSGLAMLASKSVWPRWAENLLKSPALIVLLALAFTPIAGFAHAMQLIALAQLATMIVARFVDLPSAKKPTSSLKRN